MPVVPSSQINNPRHTRTSQAAPAKSVLWASQVDGVGYEMAGISSAPVSLRHVTLAHKGYGSESASTVTSQNSWPGLRVQAMVTKRVFIPVSQLRNQHAALSLPTPRRKKWLGGGGEMCTFWWTIHRGVPSFKKKKKALHYTVLTESKVCVYLGHSRMIKTWWEERGREM